MSIGFLAGIRGSSIKRSATLPHPESIDYKRRKEISYMDWMEIWKEILPKDQYEKRSAALKKLTMSDTDFKE